LIFQFQNDLRGCYDKLVDGKSRSGACGFR